MMKKNLALASLFFIFLCLCFSSLIKNHIDGYFPVANIQVEAPFLYVSKQDIEQALTPHTKQGLVNIDNQAIKSSLSAMPWVKSVNVKKIWPGTLFIKVDERRPIAQFNDNILIDESGVSFPNTKTSTVELIKLHGIDGSEKELLQEYKKMSRLLSSISLAPKMLEINSSIIILTMKDGLKLLMTKKGAKAQLERFIRVYPELAQKKSTPILRVDMRYKHGLAVKW